MFLRKNSLFIGFICIVSISIGILSIKPANAQYANTNAGPQTGLAKSNLIVQTSNGPRNFRVELANTHISREIGMMWRQSVGRTEGMLFSFPDEAPRAFWMKNTLISLDIIYIRANGRIVKIARNAQPLTLTPIPSGAPAMAVLEIGGGEAARQGIREGDLVRHSIFRNNAVSVPQKKGNKTKNR